MSHIGANPLLRHRLEDEVLQVVVEQQDRGEHFGDRPDARDDGRAPVALTLRR